MAQWASTHTTTRYYWQEEGVTFIESYDKASLSVEPHTDMKVIRKAYSGLRLIKKPQE